MILPRPEDAFHKIQLYRLLTAILDESYLSQVLYFKGGTCASMRGLLDRFSVDLDFDLKTNTAKELVRQKLLLIFSKLNLTIKKEHPTALLFILHYEAKEAVRNNIKLSIIDNPPKANTYETVYLSEVDRYAQTQTIETMTANKLVAFLDRFEKYQTIAGRDIYDMHYFFSHGMKYRKEVICERRNTDPASYFAELIAFIKTHLTQTIIDQDLNTLLPSAVFQRIRKTLKNETLVLLADELKRIQ